MGTTTKDELKPCEVCGSSDVLTGVTKGGNYIVYCDVCFCLSLSSKSTSDAIYKWNDVNRSA